MLSTPFLEQATHPTTLLGRMTASCPRLERTNPSRCFLCCLLPVLVDVAWTKRGLQVAICFVQPALRHGWRRVRLAGAGPPGRWCCLSLCFPQPETVLEARSQHLAACILGSFLKCLPHYDGPRKGTLGSMEGILIKTELSAIKPKKRDQVQK